MEQRERAYAGMMIDFFYFINFILLLLFIIGYVTLIFFSI